MKYDTYDRAVEGKADADALVAYVMTRLGEFYDGGDVILDFLSRAQVGAFCTAIGFKPSRNWGALTLDTLAPADASGAAVVPADEAAIVLDLVQALIRRKQLDPVDDQGKSVPTIINDFLPEGHQFQGEPTKGHLWEWQYALAVELEHGRTRASNVTNNHPLLTALVVTAHLSEDPCYYARLWVMETQGEVFNAQVEGKPRAVITDGLAKLNRAEAHLAQRLGQYVA